jgi:HPt (histidine-containing phosphotransfer) domain-containing protein
MPAPVVIDPQALEDLRALDPNDGGAFVREVRDIFFEDTPLRLAELDQFLASKDAPRFSRAAHTIKGSSGNLGAIGVRDLAARLESQSKTELAPDISGLLAELKVEYERAKVEISRLVP